MSLAQTQALLEPEMAFELFGIELSQLPFDDEILLLDALEGHMGAATDWRMRLNGICVQLLDINTSPIEQLQRIPNLSANEAHILIESRPYLDLIEFSQEGSDLFEIGERIAPYVGHDGYHFVDKTAGRIVAFDVDLAEGIIVIKMPETDRIDLTKALNEVGLQGVVIDDDVQLYLCQWEAGMLPVEQPKRLRALKGSKTVLTVAPLLRDRQEQLRVPFPNRLDVKLFEDTSDIVWDFLIATYKLTVVEQYLPYYRSLRVEAHPHDLGALYRTLRAMANDAAVRLIEPTYIVI